MIKIDPLGDEFMQDFPGSAEVTGATLAEILDYVRDHDIPDTARIVYGYCGSHAVYLVPPEIS